jgi:hypothetical protein
MIPLIVKNLNRVEREVEMEAREDADGKDKGGEGGEVRDTTESPDRRNTSPKQKDKVESRWAPQEAETIT